MGHHDHGRDGISEVDAHEIGAAASRLGTLLEGAMGHGGLQISCHVPPCPPLPTLTGIAHLLGAFPGVVSWITRGGIHSLKSEFPLLARHLQLALVEVQWDKVLHGLHMQAFYS
jgi:hypothetical protein